MRSIVRALSSTKLAVALCLALAAASVAGSLLYKGNTAAGDRGAFNVFRSPFVLAPAALLVVNVLFCAARRLSSAGIRNPRMWTFAAIHAGLVLLAAGLVLDGAFGFLATQYYPPGIPLDVHRNWRTGREEKHPFTVEVVAAEMMRHPLRLRIAVRDVRGNDRGVYEVREGVPFRVAGSSLTVTPRAFDPDAKRLVFDTEGEGVSARGVAAGPEGSPPTGGYVIAPDAYHDPEPSDYVARLRFSRAGGATAERDVRINHPAVYDGIAFCIVGFNRDKYGNILVGIQMAREPGEGVFWIGALLFAAGLLCRLSLGRRGVPDVADGAEGTDRGGAPAGRGVVAAVLWGALLGPILAGGGLARAAGTVIDAETVWDGEVRVSAPVSVEKGGTLRIRPGTTVLLSGTDRDGDGCRDGYIQVLGTLLVEGEEGRPVRFARLDGDAPWEEIFLKDAVARIRHAVVEGATWGLHVHGGDVAVGHATFRGNGGGARLKGSGAVFTRCTFRGNAVGLRFWDGGPTVSASVVEENGTGLFYREGAGGGKISGSRISNREWDIKVGDWATGDLDLSGNYWGPSGRPKVKDYRERRGPGRLALEPRLDGPPLPCGAAP